MMLVTKSQFKQFGRRFINTSQDPVLQWIYHNGGFVLYCRNYYIADSFMNPGIYFGGNGAVKTRFSYRGSVMEFA